jgi:hypothetical protein
MRRKTGLPLMPSGGQTGRRNGGDAEQLVRGNWQLVMLKALPGAGNRPVLIARPLAIRTRDQVLVASYQLRAARCPGK